MNTETTDFYRKLADVYDEIFPVEASTMQFLRRAGALPGRSVLDLACGSGLYTEALLGEGVDVYGLDGSPDLIDRARTRSAHPERFVPADMREWGDRLPRSFDLVFCIGNSISHLDSIVDVRAVLHSIAESLSGADARVVIQYVDMDEIPVGSARDLPALRAGAFMFERRYVRAESHRITFDATLVHEKTGDRDAIKNQLLVLKTSDIVDWLAEFGFASVEVWGGFERQPVEGSWVRVLSAAGG
ncbi:MAG: class I SAM-dependent methyltransferase [Spirochaetia bacterium]